MTILMKLTAQFHLKNFQMEVLLSSIKHRPTPVDILKLKPPLLNILSALFAITSNLHEIIMVEKNNWHISMFPKNNLKDTLTIPELLPGWELQISEIWPPVFE